MIFLTKLDGKRVVVNDDLILFAEATPDTMLTLTTGAKLMVLEPLERVVSLSLEYRRSIGQRSQVATRPGPEAPAEAAAGNEG